MTATAAQQNLTNLLRYAEEILKIGERVIADLAKDSFLTIHEHEILGLEGVTVNPDDQTLGAIRAVARNTASSR